MEPSHLPLMLLLLSYIHNGHAEEQPKAEVIRYHQNNLTTVRCKIQEDNDDWTYSWFTDESTEPLSNDQEFNIETYTSTTISSKVTCYGVRKSDGLKSETSDPVILNLSFHTDQKRFPAVLSFKLKGSQISRGDTVKLKCDIEEKHWNYTFGCGDKQFQSIDRDYKITVESTQTCKCFGLRSSGSSEWSNKVTLTVSDSGKVSIKPQSSVFTGDNVTLSCEVGKSTGKIIYWYKNHRITNDSDETKTLTNVQISDGGEYNCKEDGGKQVRAVNLTVTERPKAVVLVRPYGHVFRGQTVTFICDIKGSGVKHWRYRWTKDDAMIQLSESQEYRISSVNKSHTGHYSCVGNEMEGSRYSHTSDKLTLTISALDYKVALIIAATVGLSVSFLLIFSLLLLWRCRKKKGEGFLSHSTDQQQHNTSQTSEGKVGEQTRNSDSVNGPSDVTYAQIEMKTKTERKKKDNTGNTGETSDTIYSKLKI